MQYSLGLFYILFFSTCTYAQNLKQIIYTDKVSAPIGPYSQAIKIGNTVYVSGQIALNKDGTLDTGSIEMETNKVIQNIKAILQSINLDLQHIVKTTIYLTDMKNFSIVNNIYSTYFNASPPARETVEVRALPKGVHIEISAIAVAL